MYVLQCIYKIELTNLKWFQAKIELIYLRIQLTPLLYMVVTEAFLLSSSIFNKECMKLWHDSTFK
jgi:hypothetical protein